MPQLTPTQIVEQETSRFLDTNFGQLDLSGCPTCLTQPSDEDELPDPRFAPLDDRGVGLGAADLKNELQKASFSSVLNSVLEGSRDLEYVAEIKPHHERPSSCQSEGRVYAQTQRQTRDSTHHNQ